MHTPPRQDTEAEPTIETFGWTLTRGEEKIDVQVTKEENDYLKSCSNQEEALEFLEKIVERQREAATAAEATQAENLAKPPSPTPTDKSFEEFTQRMSRLEESTKQRTVVQEPPPTDQLGDDGNAAHQNREEDACRDREHQFQQRTIKHLSAPSKKFYEAVRALHFQLDNPNFTDDVSKQYGDGLLRDVEENYKKVEEAREYCLEVLEPEERMQNHRMEYLDKKLDEVFLCRRVHNKYFEQQEERKKLRQSQPSQVQPPYQGNITMTAPPPLRPTIVSSAQRPAFIQARPAMMSTPFPRYSMRHPPPNPQISPIHHGPQPQNQAGFNTNQNHGHQNPNHEQSQQRHGFNQYGQQEPNHGQSQQRPGFNQYEPNHGQSQQRPGFNQYAHQGSCYGQPQQPHQAAFQVFEDQNQGSKMPAQAAPSVARTHHYTRFKLNEELALVEKFDASQPRAYMAFRTQWTNFMAKMEKEQRSNLDLYYALLKVLGGTAYDIVKTQHPNDQSYATGIKKLDDLFYNPTNLLRETVQNLLKSHKMNDSYESLLGGINKLWDAWNDLDQADLTKEQLKGLLFIAATEKNLSEESWKCWLEVQNDPKYKENPLAAFEVSNYLGAMRKAMVNLQRRKVALGPKENKPNHQTKTGRKQSTLFGSYSNTVPSNNQNNNSSKGNSQQQARGPNNTCISCGKDPHRYQLQCPKLKQMTANEIYKIMTNSGIECQMCLGLGHRTPNCPAARDGLLKKCQIKENGKECQRYHCRYLHKSARPKEESNQAPPTNQQ